MTSTTRVRILAKALRLIRGARCEHYTSGNCREQLHRTPDAPYTADRWCDACIAADALKRVRLP